MGLRIALLLAILALSLSLTVDAGYLRNTATATKKPWPPRHHATPPPNKTPRDPQTTAPTPNPTANPPHIILALADDMGWDDIGYNNPLASTPILNSLMKTGVRLNRHYTSRFCAPTRGMLMTGRMPWVIGLHSDFNLNPIESMRCMVNPMHGTFLPQRLNQGGYSSHMVGKWHLGHYRDDAMPTARGFSSYVGYLNGATIHMGPHQFMSTRCACTKSPLSVCNTLNAPGQYCVTASDMINATSDGWVAPANTDNVLHTDTLLAQEAVRVISNHNPNVPLFLYVAWGGPHDPNQAPSQFADETGIPANAKFDGSLYKQCGGTVVNQRRNVLGMVSIIDWGMGQIRDALYSKGMWENTVVIFISDNGGLTPRMDQPQSVYCGDPYYGINYPLRGSKYSFWEGGIRTVGFVFSAGSQYLPVSSRGTVYNGLITATDWRATILSLAQVPIMVPGDNGGLDSIAQWDAIVGNNASPPRTSYVFQYWSDAQRYGAIWHDINGTNHMWKLMIGWAAVGYGVGAQGPTAGLSSRDYLVAPPEMPVANLQSSLISNGLGRNCQPGCLFDLTVDPYEQHDLYPSMSGNTQAESAYQNLERVLAVAGQTALSTASSGICQNGYTPQPVDTPTDGAAMTAAQKCGAYVPWMPAPGQAKLPCGGPGGGGEYEPNGHSTE